eukprot:COSAG05_NODE_868_length_6866_cov_131.011231_1_plen_80_part_00
MVARLLEAYQYEAFYFSEILFTCNNCACDARNSYHQTMESPPPPGGGSSGGPIRASPSPLLFPAARVSSAKFPMQCLAS